MQSFNLNFKNRMFLSKNAFTANKLQSRAVNAFFKQQALHQCKYQDKLQVKRQGLKRISALTLSLVAALMLSACSNLLTEYQEPNFPEITSFPKAELAEVNLGKVLTSPQKAAQAQKDDNAQVTYPSEKFWECFDDPKLNLLIEEALLNNYDLKTATLRVEKAMLHVDLSNTENHPTATASIGADMSRALSYHQSLKKNTSSRLGIAYQLDLFSKIATLNESAYQAYRASAYDYESMRLAMVNAVASAYWKYASSIEALQIAQLDLNDSKRRLALINDKYQEGLINVVDRDRAIINHMHIEQALVSAQHDLNQAKTALNTLLGAPTDKECKVSSLYEVTIPITVPEIPATLLSNRPDLKAKEATLRRYYADYDSARLAWYPDFSISTSLSMGNSGAIARFFSDPIGALGATLTLPFLNFNKLKIQQESALKDKEIAELDFVYSYIKAVQEVYDEISALNYHENTLKSVSSEAKLSEQNYRRYFERYKQGVSSLSDFLDAADTLRNARSKLINARRNLLTSKMALLVILGGTN